MGFGNIFKQIEQNAQKIANGEPPALDDPMADEDEKVDEDYSVEVQKLSLNPSRWEKATVALTGMVKQVSRVDPDGLDIVCFGGTDKDEDPEEESTAKNKSKISIFRNVKQIKDVQNMVMAKLPGGPCHMGKAMDYVLKRAFDKGLDKRPCGILVLTAGEPDDKERLEKSLQAAAEKIAAQGYKESPLTVTFCHIGDDKQAEEYMDHLNKNMVSHKKSRKTKEVVDIVDTIKDSEIKQAMSEIRGTKASGKAGAIVGAFAGAALGVGGMYLYNKNQAKKRTKGWNGNWTASFEGMEICKLEVKDDMKGNLRIKGYPGGRTTGKYAETKHGYVITFRDADEHWKITGDIEDEHTIFWSDGTRWDEIPPNGANGWHMAGAAVAGAATGGAVGYLLDKKFFNKACKKDQCDYVIMVDRSEKMAVKDAQAFGLTGSLTEGDEDFDDLIEEYKPEKEEKNFIQSTTDKFNNMSTGEKVAVGVLGAAGVAGVVGGGVAIANAVKGEDEFEDEPWRKNAPVATAVADEGQARSAPGGPTASASRYQGGFNGKWRSTFDGDTLAVLDVEDDLDGILTIKGFLGGKTIGKYNRNAHNQQIQTIHFIDADENWAVNGEVKGSKETVVMWKDGTRWDKVA